MGENLSRRHVIVDMTQNIECENEKLVENFENINKFRNF